MNESRAMAGMLSVFSDGWYMFDLFVEISYSSILALALAVIYVAWNECYKSVYPFIYDFIFFSLNIPISFPIIFNFLLLVDFCFFKFNFFYFWF